MKFDYVKLICVMTGGFFSSWRKKEGNDVGWSSLFFNLNFPNKNDEESAEVKKTIEFGVSAAGSSQYTRFGGGIGSVGPSVTIGNTTQPRFGNIGGSAKMPRGMPTRRGLQALALILATAYATILLYQAIAPRQWIDEIGSETNGRGLIVEAPALRKMIVAAETVAVTPSVATATMVPFSTNLDDVFISVKTTKHYHHVRLPAIIDTWFQYAKDQTWFFTDRDDPYFQNLTNGHMINTKCSSSHNRRALCCKMSVEFDKFLESNKKWFCHFDDDNYVNVPRLLKLLDNYNPQGDWYLGRPSIPAPLEIVRQGPEPFKRPQKVKFWFATGGAGFCISKALAHKMMPVAGSGKFITVGDRIRLPDDVTMGYIIEYVLKKKLTVVEQFHSHLEPMRFLDQDTFHEQVSFSYSKGSRDEWNILKIDGFDIKEDPKRFKSIHCHLFPNVMNCPHR